MKLHVLVVDDDSIVLMLHKLNLKKSGFTDNPIGFLNGRKAMDYLDKNISNDDYFFILLDINMPVMDGWEFMNELKQKAFADRTFAVVVTSSVDPADKNKAAAYDKIIGFFEKPLSDSKIQAMKNYPELKRFFSSKSN